LKKIFRVGLCPCSSYEEGAVEEAVKIAMDRSGGGPLLQDNILIKANLLAPVRPELCVTTHPSVLAGLVRWVKTNKPETKVTVSDSPGYLFSGQWPLFIENCGLRSLVEKYSCKVIPLNDEGFQQVSTPGFVMLENIRIPVKVAEAGTLLNVAKCKTHVETEITACLKNTFGYLDTPTRKRAHRSGSLRQLCDAILDVHLSRVPDWNLLDAVIGMEGYGPSHGKSKPMGWIIASENALAADVVAAFMMGYADPFSIPLLSSAARRAMGPTQRNEIKLFGAKWEELPVPGFRKSPSALRRFIPTPLRGMAHTLVRLAPSWDADACTFCGACAAVCPVKAIHAGRKELSIDRTICVGCLCCHEMCPTGAMAIKPNLLARLLLNNK
jgi:uncharacterized protein (DUF362 family)/Pyruvate/2-oxoacid:ferredoxin oxidoreductase delta subunit